ncbi:MAG TPA: M20/M25/M40 family metallo-hydrolase [Candidatus Binatia bacterium]|nr:M20/M25/M40 family metallo-hydrolase [Candidatus Binatia bacterium]
MTIRTFVFPAVLAAFAASSAMWVRAQEPPAPSRAPSVVTAAMTSADDSILAEIKAHNEIMANLEYLSDMIGQRLTGSDNLKRANQWTRDRFSAYGLANVHLEAWQIAHSWTRGPARGRILSPAEHPLTLASYGWAAGTGGTVHGPVVYVKASKPEDLQAYKGKLKGAIIITAEPGLLPDPDAPAINPMLVPYRDSFLLVAPRRPAEPAPAGPPPRGFMQARDDFFKTEGVAALLTDSHKPDGLLNMTGRGGRTFAISPIPAAFITSENYSLIWRLLARGPVEVELDISNTASAQPVEVYNTVAELPGSERPEEVVILGAHLDSWDLGTGSTDNGTGSMVVLEAARALQKLGLKPRRTIRFVLFSGEEQGLCGSRAYVEAHKAELPKISAALIHDTGTGKVISIGLMGNYQDMEIVQQVVGPLHSLGLLEMSERTMGGSDHASFNAAGVPGFYGIQEPAQYFQTHHTQADTFDQAHEADLVEGAQVLAVWAYNVAQLPELLPRKPVSENRGEN